MKQTEEIRDIGPIHEENNPGFWERLLGPGNDTILERLAEQWGKQLKEGGFFEYDSLTFNYRGLGCRIVPISEYNIVTKMYDVHLDFIADYKPADGFSLRIENEGILSALAHLVGSPDFAIGDKEYDSAFSLNSNDDPRLKKICDQSNIKSAMLKSGGCELTTENPGWFNDVAEGMRRLRYRIEGDLGSVYMLNQQLQAFGDMLDGLIDTGCVKPTEQENLKRENALA